MSLRPFRLMLGLLCLSAPGLARAAMPVTDYPAARGGDTLVVMLSGDGGWARIDKAVAADLVRAGTPVAGVDALRYFLLRRDPGAVAQDLTAVIESRARSWGRRRVILVGYSFGADALPAAIPLLPPATRARLRGLVLISPGPKGETRFQPGDWFGWTAPDAYPVAPLLDRLAPLPVLCVQGAADKGAACARFSHPRVRVARLSGDHHFNRRYGALAPAILSVAP